MAEFRNKIFGLAGAALICTGMAYGQATCGYTAGTPNAVIVTAEGTTEQVAALSITCTAGAGGSAAGPITIQDFVSVPVTSKVLTTTGATEAVATICGAAAGCGFGTGASAFGTIGAGGTVINFTLTAPALAPGGSYAIAIQNVRANASTISVGTGAPPPIQSSIFITGGTTVLVPASLANNNVAFVESGISSKQFKSASLASSGGAAFVVCNSNTPVAGTGLSTIVQINEGYQSAFQRLTDPGVTTPQAAIGAGVVAAGSASNAITYGVRVKLVFNNVPANVTIYVPLVVSASTTASPSAVGDGAFLTLNAAETGATSPATAVTPSTSNGLLTSGGTAFANPLVSNSSALGQVAISGGTGTAVYEVTASNLVTLDTFNIGVWTFTKANTVAGSTTAMTTSVSFAPVGATTIPNYVVGASTTTLTGSTFNLCTTSLLLPFVTNQLGFDTGVAIANTSTDPFGTAGATPQAGTCTLNFYGNGAPTPNNTTTPNIPTGTVYANTISALAAGFQGYVIAQCQFQFAHAFVFVTDGVGPNGGLSQGYLGLIIPDTNQVGRGANPIGIAGAGTGESAGQ